MADAAVASGIVPKSTAAKLSAIESFGDAACAKPPDGDPLATAIWLGQFARQLTTLATAAK